MLANCHGLLLPIGAISLNVIDAERTTRLGEEKAKGGRFDGGKANDALVADIAKRLPWVD